MVYKICNDCIHYSFCGSHGYIDANECYYYKDESELVEVVRCKDCKHWKCKRAGMFGDYVGDCHNNDFPFLCEQRPITKETAYCSYGERKDTK